MEDQDPDLGIDSPENGVLLSPTLHTRFGKGKSVFLMVCDLFQPLPSSE
jgi:hypothetical protein